MARFAEMMSRTLACLIPAQVLLGASALAQAPSRASTTTTNANPAQCASASCEPRTAITFIPYEISSPGSYYLVKNLDMPAGATKPFGLKIATGNVTIDLNGFTLNGSQYAFPAIQSTGGEHIRVVDGSISGWAGGGIDLSTSQNCVVGNVHVDNTGGPTVAQGTAIRLGNNALVYDCAIDAVGAGQIAGGIEAGHNSIVRDSIVAGSSGVDAILVGDRCRVQGCIVQGGLRGIVAGASALVKDCTSSNNGSGIQVGSGSGIFDCVAFDCGRTAADAGITAFRSTIARCTVRQSPYLLNADQCSVFDCNFIGDSIEQINLQYHCTFRGNSVINCVTTLTSGQNHVDGNGFMADASGATIAMNSQHSDGDVFVRNFVGTMCRFVQNGVDHVAAFIVNPGAGFTTSEPWANFRVGR